MTIDKIGATNNIQKTKEIKQIDTSKTVQTDRVDISAEAKEKAHVERFMKIVADSPEIREDKVIQARERLQSYMENGTVKKEILDKLANAMTASIFED